MSIISKMELADALVDSKYISKKENLFFPSPYPFCNENVSGYLDFLDIKDKSLLTVGSSADQTISAITRGCKDITVLDICPFSEDVFYLKKSAIKTISKEDFCNLFFYRDYPSTFKYNKNPFDLKKYPSLLKMLQQENSEVYNFWLTLVSTKSGEMIRKNFFEQDEEKPVVTKQLTDYLKSDEVYYKTREQIRDIKPTFITANITHKQQLNKKFDNIILSNLTTYLSYEELTDLFHLLTPYLTENGKMIFGYLYRTDENTKYQKEWNVIYDTQKILSIDKNLKLKTLKGVKGILHETETMKDAVYIYQKKNK